MPLRWGQVVREPGLQRGGVGLVGRVRVRNEYHVYRQESGEYRVEYVIQGRRIHGGPRLVTLHLTADQAQGLDAALPSHARAGDVESYVQAYVQRTSQALPVVPGREEHAFKLAGIAALVIAAVLGWRRLQSDPPRLWYVREADG